MFSASMRRGAICDRNFPSFSPKCRCGPMIASVLASRFGMLTALRIVPSSNAARMDCAISMPTLSCASAVEAPKCGVKIKFGAERRRRYLAILQCFGQRGFIDQTPARAIDDADIALCFLQPRGIENMSGLVPQWRMQRDEIANCQQIIYFIAALDMQT